MVAGQRAIDMHRLPPGIARGKGYAKRSDRIKKFLCTCLAAPGIMEVGITSWSPEGAELNDTKSKEIGVVVDFM